MRKKSGEVRPFVFVLFFFLDFVLKAGVSPCTPMFFSCISSILKFSKLGLTFYLKKGMVVELVWYCSSSSFI